MTQWQFIDGNGTFRLEKADQYSYLYFPLVNESGMMSAITPTLHGDIKTDQHHFLTLPVSIDDLHNTRSPRDVWVQIDGVGPWSLAGNSARQIAARWTSQADTVTVEAGLLWHKVSRRHGSIPLQADVLNFVPASEDHVEIMQVQLTNTGDVPFNLSLTAATPIFGRSADNLRDHRHVTALLHRVKCDRYGVLVCPTMSFDERGHEPNDITYAILGIDEHGNPPVGFYPRLSTFIGEGGSLDWPESVVLDLPPSHQVGDTDEGYEALGGLKFARFTLEPGQTRTWVFLLAILSAGNSPSRLMEKYGTPEKVGLWLSRNKGYWVEKARQLEIHTADSGFDQWLRWVTIQPTLRRLFGNSFLPYHDYGRGGRGWRDLWQDALTMVLLEGANVADLLLANFAGVRMDGSNATIIGNLPGEFKADRNNIPRVWMDHGAWPLLTVRLYIDQTGDLEFMLREQTYFRDAFTHRCQVVDANWNPEDGTIHRAKNGDVLKGTVLEHLLVQHLTAFYNVGEHLNILLEDADWNDGLDMARQQGESVAFTAMYAWNLLQLAEMLETMAGQGMYKVNLQEELLLLLNPLNPRDARVMQERLKEWCDCVAQPLSGKKKQLDTAYVSEQLRKMGEWLYEHIRQQEWIEESSGLGWFNGYYDNRGQRVEGQWPDHVRMTLTGQVFTVMGNLATEAQVDAILNAADKYLWDDKVGGYRLNTNFQEVKLDLGRAFGFAYGHKENGAMFSHMAVMFSNALYRRRRSEAAWHILRQIYQQCQNFAMSKMYPGIPEYFDPEGRGLYPWLTGSASWLVLTLIQWVYGVRGELGDVILDPQLMPEQFGEDGVGEIEVRFDRWRLKVRYHNSEKLTPSNYRVNAVRLNGKLVAHQGRIQRALLETLSPENVHQVDVELVAK